MDETWTRNEVTSTYTIEERSDEYKYEYMHEEHSDECMDDGT
jgi:hypothetical protein